MFEVFYVANFRISELIFLREFRLHLDSESSDTEMDSEVLVRFVTWVALSMVVSGSP